MAKKSDGRKSKLDPAGHVKTSLKIRHDLWKRAHLLALERGSELQMIVNEALAEYFRKKGGSR
jgi:hypothetical protein